MKSKISAAIIVIIGLLGVSANIAAYAQQSITPRQPTTTTNNIHPAIVDLNNPSLITSADAGIGQDPLL